MKKQINISLAILFAGLFLLSGLCIVSNGETVETELYSGVRYESLLFKHNSIGYWQIESNTGNATFYDRYIDYANKDVHCYGYFQSTFQLPKEVIDARKQGKEITVKISPCGLPTSVNFDDVKYVFTSLSTLKLMIGLKPVITKYNLGNYVSGFNSFTPLIDYRYGYNQYVVYPTIGQPSYAQGFFDWLYPTRTQEPLVHPSIIKNCKGTFKSGSSIQINGETKKTTFFTIGKSGSFVDGSAVNLVFYAPYKITYFVKETSTPIVPDTPVVPTPPSNPDDSEKENPKANGLRIHRLIFSVLRISS